MTRTGKASSYTVEVNHPTAGWVQPRPHRRSLDKALRQVDFFQRSGWAEIRIRRTTTEYWSMNEQKNGGREATEG